MKEDTSIRAARAEMEAAKAQSEKTFSPEKQQQLPRRFRLYDKIKENVSLGTVNAVILITAALIIVLLIYGILTANPSQ